MKPREPSGRFVLRLPPEFHAQLRRSARVEGMSLNEHCVRSLARAEASRAGPFEDVVARAIEQLGSGLVGVAVFGSYARGGSGPSSDVDVLLATAPEVEVTRSLYAPWDAVDFDVDGHRVEPHIVRLPDDGDPIRGLWAEIALDGIVIYDPDFVLARALIRVRRVILAGGLVRRAAGGVSWWTAA